MAKQKFYFRDQESEMCYSLEYHLMQAKEEGLASVDLYEALPDKVPGYFFCEFAGAIGEDGSCGKQCEGYEPINGKSGKCHNKGLLYTSGDVKTFKIE